jgi:3-oxoacyl-[acyl-carrier protein] reductase
VRRIRIEEEAVNPSFDLTGHVIVITGAASGGIGAAAAQTLTDCGAAVVCLDYSEAGLDRTLDAVGGKTTGRVVDVTDAQAVTAAAEWVVAEQGHIDGWVNAAGVVDNHLVTDISDEQFNAIFDVNFRGTLYGCQAAARAMGDRGGSIVNLASTAIDVHAPTLIAYTVSKASVSELTRTLASEVGSQGIRVNAIAPGFIETKMTSRHFTSPDGTVDLAIKEERHAPMRRMAALGRVGEPADIANAIHYLVADASSFVTGQVLRVNGGGSMPL